MLPPENSYGMQKRIDFVEAAILRFKPRRVLDFGCGVGTLLTLPLAQDFPETSFWGTDNDAVSIEFARKTHVLPNIKFSVPHDIGDHERFDLVIVSEVIEHVEDPETFLSLLKGRLIPEGKIVLTVPNGYGPFEISCLMETLLHYFGVLGLMRKFRRRSNKTDQRGKANNVDTLADSPHINFFSNRLIRAVMANAGLKIIEYRPRTFLCGFGFDQVLRGQRLLAWNAQVSNRLPPFLCSDWMFLAEGGQPTTRRIYKRNAYARVRRYLNEKRWNLR